MLQYIVKMSLDPFQKMGLLFVMFILSLFNLTNGQKNWDGWQGSGNMSQSNITEIRSAINNNPITPTTTDEQIDAIAQTISLRLNSLWNPAWNVAIAHNYPFFEVVLYGYAFRDHWMWINAVMIPSGDRALAYIIWKDYNCHTWKTVGEAKASSSTFTSEQLSVISSYSFSGVQADVWGNAHSFVDFLERQPSLMSGAYTVVMNMVYVDTIRGYFCMLNNNYHIRTSVQVLGSSKHGAYFMFQTR